MRILSSLKRSVRASLRRHGIEISGFRPTTHHLARRMRLMDHYGIATVLDAGANTGHYALELRSAGFRGDIISFEPLTSAYAQLLRSCAADRRWRGFNVALGERSGTAEINIAGNSMSSSLLPMLSAHSLAAPESRYIGTERVIVRRLDSFSEELGLPSQQNLYLKIDTQGYERFVLEGAKGVLSRIVGVQLEMSLVSLYEGELLLENTIGYMKELGFALMGLEPGFVDEKTGRLLQADGLFYRPAPE